MTVVVTLMAAMLPSGNVGAQFLEVLAEFDTNQVRIGEVFHLNLSVEQTRGMMVEFPALEDTLVDKVEILETFPPDSIITDDVLKIDQQYRLICFDSGFYEIPSLVFGFRDGDWIDSLGTHPLYLLVHTVAVDSAIYDIKSPIHVPVGFMEVFPYATGGLILLALAGFLVWYLRRRSRGESVFTPSVPEEPAHIIALRELDGLKSKKLWQQGEFKEYYTGLTGIIRRYMERRYSIQAMEMTSTDIIRAWSDSGEDKEGLSVNLDRLLNLADLVKFAKEKPIASDNEENMEIAYDFIHKTKQVRPLYGDEAEAGDNNEQHEAGIAAGIGTIEVHNNSKAAEDVQ